MLEYRLHLGIVLKDFCFSFQYDETITMKCLRCNHEETIDWEMIEEMFDERFERYPLLHCPKCGKSKFVPIDIYKEQKL